MSKTVIKPILKLCNF